MKGCKSVKVLAVVFLLVFFLGFEVSLFPETKIKVEITVPERDGIKVGRGMTVKGTASIPGGNYLWVLAHRMPGFEDVWWPQNEGKVDSETKKWSVYVVFGQPQDVGYDFEIAAIVVNEKEHVRLKNYRENAMRTGDWRPIPMPQTVVAPVFRTVRKVGNN